MGRLLGVLFLLAFSYAAAKQYIAAAAVPRVSGAALRVAQAAEQQVGKTLVYDARYERLRYPMGDVALERGVCADVVVRALRAVGRDLQGEVHEDMRANFGAYPRAWGLRKPDPNIDHRRVLNLQRYFERRDLAVGEGVRFQPGDIVAWRLSDGKPHIGVVSTQRNPWGRYLVVHNIGRGARVEDVLQRWRLSGHYRLPAVSAI